MTQRFFFPRALAVLLSGVMLVVAAAHTTAQTTPTPSPNDIFAQFAATATALAGGNGGNTGSTSAATATTATSTRTPSPTATNTRRPFLPVTAFTVIPSRTPSPTQTPEPTEEITAEATVEATATTRRNPAITPLLPARATPTVQVTVEVMVETTPETTVDVTTEVTQEITVEPTAVVTEEATVEATVEPTTVPTEEVTVEPTAIVTEEATVEATVEPTTVPTEEVTVEATVEITPAVTQEVTAEATVEATMQISPEVTAESTLSPEDLGVQGGVATSAPEVRSPTPEGTIVQIDQESPASNVQDPVVGATVIVPEPGTPNPSGIDNTQTPVPEGIGAPEGGSTVQPDQGGAGATAEVTEASIGVATSAPAVRSPTLEGTIVQIDQESPASNVQDPVVGATVIVPEPGTPNPSGIDNTQTPVPEGIGAPEGGSTVQPSEEVTPFGATASATVPQPTSAEFGVPELTAIIAPTAEGQPPPPTPVDDGAGGLTLGVLLVGAIFVGVVGAVAVWRDQRSRS